MTTHRLILGSSSSYRQRLLMQLGVRFESISPGIDEAVVPGESPAASALRLGREKAMAVQRQVDAESALVMGSDQVCHLKGSRYGKPGTRERAIRQLETFSGQQVTFSTSLILLGPGGRCWETIEDYLVQFRTLSSRVIEDYVDLDEPWDCAGAIKVECAGITLLSETRGRDINGLYGLPLMALCDGLLALGYDINDFR